MAFQETDFLVLDGLSILDDPRPSSLQPPLENGVYLRWAFGSKRAFPLHGYHLFRRAYGDPAQRCLGPFLGALPLGPLQGNALDTPLGRLSATPSVLMMIDSFDPRGSAEMSLAGQRTLRLDLPPGVVAGKVTAKIGFLPRQENGPPEISVRVLRGNRLGSEVKVRGAPGEVVRPVLQADGITSVVIGGGPAALLDLCYWVTEIVISSARANAGVGAEAAASSQPGPWTMVPGFSYPLTLPITHPVYPASQGEEALSVRRAEAAQRIRYGSAAEALPAQPRTPGTGTLTLFPGSALATGQGTAWDESLVGKMIFPRPPATAFEPVDRAYAVMAVLAPDRLVLSRTYYGWWLAEIPYEISAEDVFAQVHDQIGAVLDQPEAMRAAMMPPVLETSTASRRVVLQDGSRVVKQEGVLWSWNLEGLLLEVGPNRDVYRIVKLDPDQQEITLHAPYAGPSGPAAYRILSRSPHNRIEEGPSLSFRPLDLLEIASLSPAYAQLLGLSWIDASAERGATYDYMLIADHASRFQGDGAAALRWLNGAPDWTGEEGVDGALLTGIQHSGSGALALPSALQVFALPAGRPRQTPERPDLADTEPGLSITDLASWPSRPPAQRPLLLDVWRVSHGPQTPPATPPGPQAYKRIDRFMPSSSRRDPAQASPRPPGWPDPASVHFIDGGSGGLDVGWYSYRMSAVDLYGRYSALSPPIPWHDAADGHQLHAWAVHLEDRTPPPPPIDVTAWILEPDSVNDPMRVADAAYTAWRAKVGPNVVGLRVRWRWPWSHELRAPDLEEFRVYAQPKPLNARFHRIVAVVPAPGDATRSLVKLAAADSLANDAYAGAILQVKERGYPIEGSRGGTSLELRVKNGGPRGGEAPPVATEATIVLPPGQTLHRNPVDPRHWERWFGAVAQKAPPNATVRHDIEVMEDPDGPTGQGLRGTGARWTAATRALDLLPPKIGRVRPGSDRIYLRVTPASTTVNPQHFFEIESVDATQGRLVLAGATHLLTNGQAYDWRIGTPVRIYEAFFPSQNAGAPDDPKIAQEWLKPSLSEPVVYGTVGVSAADKRKEVADVRPGRTPPRPGNEGLLGNPATVFRVHRTEPDAPADGAWDAERLLATRANYHGKSYFSVRWPKPGPVKRQYFKALIFRASEETLFQVDAEQPRTFPLTFTAAADPRPGHWNAARKAAVAAKLFAAQSDYQKLRALPTLEAKLEKYRQLSDDALSVLANLSGNSEAFAQVTIDPLDLRDGANDDRRGLDDDATYKARPTMNSWLDELPGRTQTRYLYKIAYVDSAQNRGPLGKASPPVYLPKVVPPRTPVITKIVGGDRQITIHWATNREPDLAGYRVYRTDDKERARDVRLMELVGTLDAVDPDPTKRKGVVWTDSSVPARKIFYYRVAALDSSNNSSAASAPAAGQAYDQTPPPPPVWVSAEWKADGSGISLAWSADPSLRTVIQRHYLGAWLPASGVLADGTSSYVDDRAVPGTQNRYRLQVRNSVGMTNIAYAEIVVKPK